MTTVGYGNVTASSSFGRMVACMTAFWGMFVLSLLVGSVASIFEQDKETINSTTCIKMRRKAAEAIA